MGKKSHTLVDCPRKKDVHLVQQECKAIQANIGQPPASTCPHCLLPIVVCRRYHITEGLESTNGVTCQFPDVVLPAVVSVMLYDINWDEEEFLSSLEKDMVDINQPTDVHRWLGEDIEWVGIHYNYICQHFSCITGIATYYMWK